MNSKITIPASYFSVVLGLYGLGNCWRLASKLWAINPYIGECILFLVVIIWFVLLFWFSLKWILNHEHAKTEVNTPILNYFVGLVGAATALVSLIILPYNYTIALVLFVFGAISQLYYGVHFTTKLWQTPLNANNITPALYIPTVAGNFISAMVAGNFGYTTIGMLFFGIGFISWFSLESIISNRIKNTALPELHKPSIGIMMAPPAIACAAYFANVSGKPDLVTKMLLGYAFFQFLVFLKLFLGIVKQSFAMSFWSFSFGITTLTAITMQFVIREENPFFDSTSKLLFVFANLVLIALFIKTIGFLFNPQKK